MIDAAERDVRGVEVPDPYGGDPYVFRPLTAKRAAHWWDQLATAEENGMGGLLDPDIRAEFMAEVETTDGERLEDLPFNVPEVFALARRFLARTRPGWSPWPGQTETQEQPQDAST